MGEVVVAEEPVEISEEAVKAPTYGHVSPSFIAKVPFPDKVALVAKLSEILNTLHIKSASYGD